MLKVSSKGSKDTLHHPGGGESIAYRSVGHAHHVDALRQALKQGLRGDSWLVPAGAVCPRRGFAMPAIICWPISSWICLEFFTEPARGAGNHVVCLRLSRSFESYLARCAAI